jgi:hypothetical protein
MNGWLWKKLNVQNVPCLLFDSLIQERVADLRMLGWQKQDAYFSHTHDSLFCLLLIVISRLWIS